LAKLHRQSNHCCLAASIPPQQWFVQDARRQRVKAKRHVGGVELLVALRVKDTHLAAAAAAAAAMNMFESP
jgi:hypothetical protein